MVHTTNGVIAVAAIGAQIPRARKSELFFASHMKIFLFFSV